MVVVGYYFRFSLSYRNIVKTLRDRGITVHHTTIMRLIDGREADSVNYARRIIAEYGDVIKSVTCDDGSEFSELSSVLTGAAAVYYVHPYRSSERGTNEAHNKMVRRDFPKGKSLDVSSLAAVTRVEDKLNRLPR